MSTIHETIPDLGNEQSGIKGIFDKISKRTDFALSPREYEGIIQSEDYRHFRDKRGLIDFKRHFLVVFT